LTGRFEGPSRTNLFILYLFEGFDNSLDFLVSDFIGFSSEEVESVNVPLQKKFSSLIDGGKGQLICSPRLIVSTLQ